MRTDITYLTLLVEKAEILPHLLKPLLSVTLRHAKGSGVDDAPNVLMKVFRDKVHVPLSECLDT